MRILIHSVFILLLLSGAAKSAPGLYLPQYALGGGDEPSDEIQVYLSPTSRHSSVANVFALTKLLNNEELLKSTRLVVSFVPRNEEEVEIINLLTCVPQEYFAPFAHTVLVSAFPGETGVSNGYSMAEMIEIGQQLFELPDTDLDSCNTVEKRNAQLYLLKSLAVDAKKRVLPVWKINGEYVNNLFFWWQLEPYL